MRPIPQSFRDLFSADAHSALHLINPLWDDHGGSDWRTIEMYRTLRSEANVHLWSRFSPAQRFALEYPVELIRPWQGRIPRGGTFVFVGVYFRVGHWFKLTLPRRTILIYNTHQPDRLHKALHRLRSWHRTPVELVYTSPMLRRLSGYPGVVIESPIDLMRFSPRAVARDVSAGRFRVGRLSRDIATKHHEHDPLVYSALLEAGVDVRVMGGACLSSQATHLPPSALIAAGSEPAAEFLRGLDCFYYRTSDRWLEAYGRVVFEAMACGLPVVCGRQGGYADYIVDGVNGFLVDSNEQAVKVILRLRDDPELRMRIGRAARISVERLYGGADWQRKQSYFRLLPERGGMAAREYC
jgi:glycosyltransferase involved in cell wall biosynthesis